MLENITNYKNVGDWFYLATAALVVDFIFVVREKYISSNNYFNVKSLDDWYTKFRGLAVVSDVLSILIGIMVTRYIYTFLKLNNPLYFLVILICFQILHDVFFNIFIIKPMPKGHNEMIDVFKSYTQENGHKILVADAIMMLLTIGIGSFLKMLPSHYTIATAFITMYSFTYILYTRSPQTSSGSSEPDSTG
jgi:uncharacterized protein YacL